VLHVRDESSASSGESIPAKCCGVLWSKLLPAREGHFTQNSELSIYGYCK